MRASQNKTVDVRARLLCAMASAVLAITTDSLAGDTTTQVEAKLPPAARTQVDFTKDVQPLFEKHCYGCHGPKKQESGLRLDNADSALKGGDMGPAYIPGKSAASPLVLYASGADENILMPPVDANMERLTAREIGLIRAWIDQGAQRPKIATQIKHKKRPEEHWAFRRPLPPKVPDAQVRGWVRNPIDSFVLARLDQEGLSPAEEADRSILVRRLSLDLTGLPPTLDEARNFVNDSRLNAYDRLADRLLHSPHYGERWALWWLDLARYADTNGYEIDRPRSIWLYRDWVVSAFNSNMPFDQFTIEQLAGDLLPNATTQQRIATGFHRNTFINEEGGHDWEQFRWESVVDRVNTTSTAFLGLTMACAQCHDHKYDPITQREYYEFFAFLNDDDEPILEVPQPKISKERDQSLAKIAELEQKLVERLSADSGKGRNADGLAQKFETWKRQASANVKVWTPVEPLSWKSENNATLTKLSDKSLLASGDNPEHDAYTVTYRVPPGRITGIRLEALPDASLPKHGPGRGYLKEDGTFLLSEISLIAREVDAKIRSSAEQHIKLVHPTASIRQEKAAETIDGDKLTGWHIRGGAGKRQVIAYELKRPFRASAKTELTLKLLQNFAHQQTIGRFRVWITADAGPFEASDMPLDVERALLRSADEWSESETNEVKKYYVSIAPELDKDYAQIAQLRKRLPEQPTTMILAQRPTKRVTHQHVRGDFSRPGPEVTANVPAFLPPLPAGGPRNRLTLAQWLVNEKNPLTARVIVNQIWQCYFGRGLVNTPEDFGAQGSEPSHPDLLDWLACQLIKDGWNLKQLHRLIVTSATYRQSSATDKQKQAVDPENILLSHAPRFRLPAEAIRDVSLAASGLLNPEIGGPSVFTPQPSGALAGAFGDPKWPTATGPDRFRRAIYTHRKRGAPYAAFAAFDAPLHNTCVMRRVRSNTPLQALAQLNDEMLIAASQALAGRIVNEDRENDTARLEYGFKLCLSRGPNEDERRLLLSYFYRQQKRFRQDQGTAAIVAGVSQTDKSTSVLADRAAWTLVGRALLNLDEAISKE